MTRGRYWLFLIITVLTPFIFLGVVELGLRVVWPGGAVPVFVRAPAQMGDYLLPNPALATRYFSIEQRPPSPIVEPFAAHKPAKAFRLFVLGESTAAGFPWPPTGTFSHLLQDVLRDVMPGDSVEVINLAIPATNSYAVLDQTGAVIAQHPDAVLIFLGHNEYYGALGVGSTESVGSSPAIVRAYLWMERFRTFMLLRRGVTRLRRMFATQPAAGPQAASFMETVAADQQIPLDGPAYRAGVRQLQSNLQRILARFREAGVPVFIGSQVSDDRDLHPFASPANAAAGGADAVYDSAQAADARHDSVDARRLYVRARDLDVVRFRAPSAFNDVIRSVAREEHATYVPVVEAFRAASPQGIVGHNLILEHVHPNQEGEALIARTFWQALDSAHFEGHAVQLDSMKPWADYVAGMDITPFDRRIVAHTVATLTSRWPFVPAAQATDYRGTYRPSGAVDSLAFLASAGLPWRQAKVAVGAYYEKAGFPDSALAEYRGLMRDVPIAAIPYELAGRALMQMKKPAQAMRLFLRAYGLQPTPFSAYTLGVDAAQRKDFQQAVTYLREAVSLDPTNPQPVYQLSLTYALMRDLQGAQAAAMQVYRLNPNYPGIQNWMRALGMGR
ncbi:MAG TPA: GDSL-type esterase/lipase family protein [Gemmatimonadaceae bacterium]|nr:GDSL-type esterase/lipase family protein [Gemmatimonadaceae bacterium]